MFDAAADVMNAANPGDRKVLRRGYNGSAQPEAVLQEAEKELSAMRVGSAKFLHAFQKGWLVFTRSLR